MAAGNAVRRYLTGSAGTHSARRWRSLLVMASYVAVVAILALIIGLKFLPSMLVPFVVPLAFLSGYCYRQAVLDSGRLPRFQWLWLKDDPLLRQLDDDPPPGAS